ncbi:hypothetical protein, partial [Lysinibacillus sp. NPDC093688]|uniref:hypothetical protein n=1 Tax=Lysinibacillus sp. NPDC093688 TaxID=3390577 RepID=UPI003D09442C
AAGSRANTMLVTKALSQDVMVLAFVPLLLIPEESPSLHYNQPQQQVFSVRKRSDSNKCLIYENIVAVTTNVQSTLFCSNKVSSHSVHFLNAQNL